MPKITAPNMKKACTLSASIDKDVAHTFKKYCFENDLSITKEIENLIRELLKTKKIKIEVKDGIE